MEVPGTMDTLMGTPGMMDTRMNSHGRVDRSGHAELEASKLGFNIGLYVAAALLTAAVLVTLLLALPVFLRNCKACCGFSWPQPKYVTATAVRCQKADAERIRSLEHPDYASVEEPDPDSPMAPERTLGTPRLPQFPQPTFTPVMMQQQQVSPSFQHPARGEGVRLPILPAHQSGSSPERRSPRQSPNLSHYTPSPQPSYPAPARVQPPSHPQPPPRSAAWPLPGQEEEEEETPQYDDVMAPPTPSRRPRPPANAPHQQRRY